MPHGKIIAVVLMVTSFQAQAFAQCSLTSCTKTSLNGRAFAVEWQWRPSKVYPSIRLQSLRGGSSGSREYADKDIRSNPNLPVLLRSSHARAIWTCAWPAMAIGILRTLYGVTDALWIGRLGSVELEAMGATSFGAWIVLISGEVASVGVHAVASAQEGAGRRSDIRSTVIQGLWIALLTSAVMGISCLAFNAIPAYFNLLGLGAVNDSHAAAVRKAGSAYLRWCLGGAFPMAAAGVLASAFKGIGVMTPALAATALSVAFNAALDPLLIWGCPLLKIPRMGVAGAAVATIASSILAVVLLAVRLPQHRVNLFQALQSQPPPPPPPPPLSSPPQPVPQSVPSLKTTPEPTTTTTSRAASLTTRLRSFFFSNCKPLLPRWLDLPELRTCLHIASIGAPVAASGVLFTAAFVGLGRLLTGLGPANLAALGIGQRIESLQYTVNEAFAAAAATLVGQWLGAGQKVEARKAAAATAKFCVLLNLPFALCGFFYAEGLVRLFTEDPGVVAAAAGYLRAVSVVFPLSAIEITVEGALAGAGDTLPCLAAGLVLNAGRLPLAICLAPTYGIDGVWLAIALSTAAKALWKGVAFKRSPLPAFRAATAAQATPPQLPT